MKILRLSGFSLLELILVLTIIGILSGIAMPLYNGYIVKARVVGALSMLSGYKLKISEYYLELGKIPELASTIFSGSSKLELKNSEIASINYKLENNLPVLYAELKHPPSSNKKYVYLWGIMEDEFITWLCGGKNKADSVPDIYYPKTCLQ